MSTFFNTKSSNLDTIELSEIQNIWVRDNDDGSYDIRCTYKEQKDVINCEYNSSIKRDKDFNKINEMLTSQSLPTNKKRTPVNILKQYFNAHQDAIITLAFILVIDTFIFEGKFKSKIMDMVDRLLGGIENKLVDGKNEV